MTFANFMFALFILLSLGVFVVLVLLMRQIKQQGLLNRKKLRTLTALLFIPAVLLFVFGFNSIYAWRAEIKHAQQKIEIDAFTARVYPPLSRSQRNSRVALSAMQSLLASLDTLEKQHPNQSKLIKAVRQHWSQAHATLVNADKLADKEVRRAWISYTTMNRQDVLDKFSQHALHIDKQLNRAYQQYQNQRLAAQTEIVNAVDKARKRLNIKQQKTTSKRQRQRNATLWQDVQPMNEAIKPYLLQFIGGLDTRLVNDIKTLHELARIAKQQTVVLRDHLKKNPDLEKPLSKVIEQWGQLEQRSNTDLANIYAVLNTEFVARKLDLPVSNPAIKAMNQSLLTVIPLLKTQGLAEKKAIEHSYSVKLNTQ